jgi:DNA-binding response OmpR family regulator
MQPAAVDVLVVEKDAAQSAILAHAIRETGLTTDVAGDVVESKRLLARERYRVLILALDLPDGSGIDVLDFIRAEQLPGLQIIVIADTDTSPLMSHLDPEVVNRVRFKPVRAPELASLVLSLAGKTPPITRPDRSEGGRL